MKTQKRDNLWAPWRLEYIKSNKDKSGCPFCLALKEKPSYKNLVLFKDQDIAVIMNKFPYNPYHLLVIPTKHFADLSEIPSKTSAKLSLAVIRSYENLLKIVKCEGANIGINLGSAAGAGIPGHLHWHIVPRWHSDTNFMPVIGETKAIPTHNRKAYQTLCKVFDGFADQLSGR